ncbi:Tripartite-type tricarboxylate transporter, receptor component TctC [Rhodoferax sp. OV413]|uniref:Bug family tripartite tricarboxylate transporter substrate binding protein n=1 Tax=Rhodoferax sp. OV413 TaxID=1855285 RepID=UPI000886BA37|nr:tripartite tricarboxylate transporter substrate-binding protein [Rhodoferax sp. OV413]SDP61097.1 Tripartite-type tricarboxylate transporter, receptor component TctC [Rhodoferax sp. OV413]
MKRRDFIIGGGAAAAIGVPIAANAQGNNFRIIVGFAAGAGADAIARKLADKLRESLEAPVIVENVPGVSGRLAATQVKQAAPNGRTMLLAPSTTITIVPNLFPNDRRYDPVRDFIPVTGIATVPLGFVVGPAAKGTTLAEYVRWAKSDPKNATYASPGAGSGAHFMGAMFAKAAGLEMAHVPYKGAAPAQQDLLAGQVPAYAGIIGRFVIDQHKAGRIKVLAMSQPQRSPYLPDVPTFSEAGFSSVVASEWTGLFLPAKTPTDIVDNLHQKVVAALQQPDLRKLLADGGQEPIANSRTDFAAQIGAELTAWGPVIRASGFKLEE